MTKPVLEYYWIKLLEDGTQLPQFDKDGKETHWHADNRSVEKVLLVPFDISFADKVTLSGTPAIAFNNQPIEFIVRGELVECGRDNAVITDEYFQCDICGWKFHHTDSSKYAKCPQCGVQDDWYCSRCGENKTEFKVTEKGQVQCKDCEIPTGLDRKMKLFRMTEVKHICDYFIRTPTRKLTITDSGKIILE
jgi:predicted RNA-binding Zn-ribbon protein involved in translation (DUF1610 family)